jgi:hypothetical protein
MATNDDSDNSGRQVVERAKTEQRHHRVRLDAALCRFIEQANQLRRHHDGEKRSEDTGRRVGELAPDSTLKDHFLTLVKNCSDNRLFANETRVA